MNKRTYIYSIILIIGLICNDMLHAQTLTIRFFAPTATMTRTFGAGNVQAMRYGSARRSRVTLPGYRSVVVTAANEANFRRIAPAIIKRSYDSLTTAGPFKTKVDQIMQLSGGVVDVEVWLIDDRTAFPARDGYVGGNADPRGSSNFYVWPSARNWRVRGGRYGGMTNLGAHFGQQIASRGAGGNAAWEATILHELSHTQMLPDRRVSSVYNAGEMGRYTSYNKWGQGGLGVSYGGDQGHWGSELMADEQSALDEALGSFWGITHNPADARSLLRWLNRSNYRFLLGSRSFLSGVPSMWDAPHREDINVRATRANLDPLGVTLVRRGRRDPYQGRYARRTYKWLDVPGKFVYYNERMNEGYLYLYWQHAFPNRDTAFTKFIRAASRMMSSANERRRYTSNFAYHLSKEMEAYASTAAGQREAANNTLTSSLFAFALLDLLGHFSEPDASFRRRLNVASYEYGEPNRSRAHLQYMSHRAALRRAAQPHIRAGSIDIMAATRAIRDYCRQAANIMR